MTLPPSYDSWLQPPDPFECDECEDGPGCTCEQDAADEREADQLARGEADRDAERDDAEDARVRRG